MSILFCFVSLLCNSFVNKRIFCGIFLRFCAFFIWEARNKMCISGTFPGALCHAHARLPRDLLDLQGHWTKSTKTCAYSAMVGLSILK
jgi:hypothetical protein